MSHEIQQATRQGTDFVKPMIRLDQLQNPLGPVERVIDAVAHFDGWSSRGGDMADELRRRLAARAGVTAEWIVLANGIDELHAMIAQWRNTHGPILLFPPSDTALEHWLLRHSAQIELIPRRKDFSLPVEAGASSLPRGGTAVVMSPDDPTGTIMTVQEAVRLSRQSAVVVIDERHAAYSPRTLAPLVREFENMVLLQTFETFAALTAFPLAWAMAPPSIAREIAARARPSGPAKVSLVAALAAMDAQDEIAAKVRQVMGEKQRLFRQLRKLSMISPPYPSWGNFLLARIERGTSDFFVPRLADRGIAVHRVDHPRLPNHLRISAISLDATYALKKALIEIALDL
jgi:histidinol-phosphate aminotransferase